MSTKSGEGHVLGVDLLGTNESVSRLAKSAVDIGDELEFVASPDSVVVPSSWLSSRGYALEDTISVTTADGPTSLVIRGSINSPEMSALFGGQFLLMDLPAAQVLVGYERTVDYIDVWTDDDTNHEELRSRITSTLAGRGFVADAAGLARRATELLFARGSAVNL